MKIATDHSLKGIVKKINDDVKIELKYIAPKRANTEADEQEPTEEQSRQESLSIELEESIALIDFSSSKPHASALLKVRPEETSVTDSTPLN